MIEINAHANEFPVVLLFGGNIPKPRRPEPEPANPETPDPLPDLGPEDGAENEPPTPTEDELPCIPNDLLATGPAPEFAMPGVETPGLTAAGDEPADGMVEGMFALGIETPALEPA
jgi:hypothetical protein